jgi:nucleoside-diphosphate-sugar epimerase
VSPVLVTGGSGYVGTQLIAALLRDGREVRTSGRSIATFSTQSACSSLAQSIPAATSFIAFLLARLLLVPAGRYRCGCS